MPHAPSTRPARTPRAIAALVVALGTLAAGVVVLGAAPASAERLVVRDPDDPGRFGPDVRRLRVGNDRPGVVRLALAYDGGYADLVRIWVDTDPSDKGPERLLVQSIDAAGAVRRFSVYRVDGWADEPRGRELQCSPGASRATGRGDRTVVYPVPRSCLGGAGTVRASAYVRNEIGGRDHVPSARHFSAPVVQG